MKRFAMAMVMLLSLTGLAQARYHHGAHHHHGYRSYDAGSTISHPAGCPWSAFCGCGVSVKVFGHAVRNLYLASNWYRFPRTSPHSGAVAVRNHHVFYIETVYGDGTVLAYDPNSGGHQTREHRVSLAGYVVVDPHGGNYEVSSRHLRHYASRHYRHVRHYARRSVPTSNWYAGYYTH
jgi:hypothetical protein